MTLSPHLRLDIQGPVARLLIDRPGRKGAFDQAMWLTLPLLVEQAMADPAVRLLVLTGAAPGQFCAGADIGEFSTASADPAWRRENAMAIRGAQIGLARAPKPTLAVVDGDAVGGGCGLAMACDLRIATPASRFGITPAKLGLVYPLHDTRLLVELVGPAQARRLLYSATLVPAAEALRIGLVQLIADTPAVVADYIASVVRVSGYSQRASKAVIQRIIEGAHDDDARSQTDFDTAFTGDDFAEGVAAFLAKRPPVFRA